MANTIENVITGRLLFICFSGLWLQSDNLTDLLWPLPAVIAENSLSFLCRWCHKKKTSGGWGWRWGWSETDLTHQILYELVYGWRDRSRKV